MEPFLLTKEEVASVHILSESLAPRFRQQPQKFCFVDNRDRVRPRLLQLHAGRGTCQKVVCVLGDRIGYFSTGGLDLFNRFAARESRQGARQDEKFSGQRTFRGG